MVTELWQIIQLIISLVCLLLQTYFILSLTKSLLHSFLFSEFTIPEIIKVLNDLKLVPGCSPDSLQILFSECGNGLSDLLYLMFTKSVSCMQVSLLWKMANVMSLFKGSAHLSPSNYRPISLTSITSKPWKDLLFQDFMNTCMLASGGMQFLISFRARIICCRDAGQRSRFRKDSRALTVELGVKARL